MRLLDSLADSYAPLAVVVNENLEILHTLGDPSGVFKVPTGRAVYDISKMVNRELAIPLATGIQKILRTGEELAYSNVRLHEGDATNTMRLRMRPLPGRKSDEALVVIFFESVEKTHAENGAVPPEYDLDAETGQRMQDLEQELQFTRENLQATIEELETSNEELQATNEELLASNEELQSTNEELQSANEELYTVNAEYQNKIIELTEANNDVDNLLSSSRIGTLILDEDMCIRRYSPQAADVFNLVDSDIGRPLQHLSHRLCDFDAVEMARQALQGDRSLECEARDNDDHWYLVRALPYRVGPQAVAGVVITLIDITERKQAEEALNHQKYLLEKAQELGQIGTWQLDLRENVLRWTDETCRIFGVPPGSVVNYEIFLDKVHPDDRDYVNGEWMARVAGKPYDIEHRLLIDGVLKWVREKAHLTFDDNGVATSAVGFTQDITERKRAEERLSESELRYRTLADHGHALIWTSGLDKKCDYFNRVWLEFTGRTMEKELGDGWTEGVHPDDLDRCFQTYVAAFEKRESFSMTYRLRRHDGQYRWIQDDGSPRFDDADSFIGYIGHCFDVTERMEAEQALRESDERHRHLYHLLADAEKIARMGSWTWDVPSDTVTWSENLYELFRRDPAAGAPSFADHDPLYTTESMARLREAVQETLERGTPYELKLDAMRDDKSIMPCVARGQAECDEAGSVERLYGSFQEVNE